MQNQQPPSQHPVVPNYRGSFDEKQKNPDAEPSLGDLWKSYMTAVQIKQEEKYKENHRLETALASISYAYRETSGLALTRIRRPV